MSEVSAPAPELLDAAVFDAEGFDAFVWVEEALATRGGDTGALSALVPQLALRSQSLTTTLHGSLQQLARAAPQLQTQLAAMQDATAPLSRRLDSVYAHATTTAAATDASGSADREQQRQQQKQRDLKHLVTLHDAKQRLQSCSQALVEAARWGRNVRACFAVLEDPALLTPRIKGSDKSGRNPTLAERVSEMRASLEVLRDMPGHWDRQQTMDRLSAQIEAAMKPKLTASLQNDASTDTTPLRWCLEVLSSVDRASLVREQYCVTRPANLHRVWFAFSGHHDNGSGQDDNTDAAFHSWLEGFYAQVLRMLQRETDCAREVFGSDSLADVLLALLHHTLEPLTSSFRDRLVHADKDNSQFSLHTLLRCFRATRAFAGQVVQLFRTLESDAANPSAEPEANAVLQTVFEPYHIYFTEYSRFASEALTDELLRLVPTFETNKKTRTMAERDPGALLDSDDLDDDMEDKGVAAPLEQFSQRLEDASTAIWTCVDQSLQQCYEFSGGAAFPEAIEAAGAAVQQFTLTLSATVPSIRAHCALDSTSSTTQTGGLAASPDWSQFHASLALLKACGVLERELCLLDARVRVRMREQLAQFLGDASSPRTRRKKSHDAINTTLADLVDPTKLVAAVTTMWLREEDATRQSQFHQLELELLDPSAATASADSIVSHYPTASLLDEAQRAVRSWTKDVQLLTFDTVFLPIARVLETVPASESWRKVPDAALGDLPTFSALPQDYITTVADLLLSLLPQLEPFAESSSLESAFVASRGAQDVCVQSEWSRLGQLLHLAPPELSACQQIFTAMADVETESKSADAEAETPSTATATEFVDLWTASVASGTLAALLRVVCSVPALSELGARQLAADLSYFHNVLSAVGGEGNWLVDDLRRTLETDLQAHRQHADELRAAHDSVHEQALAKLHDRLVAMRQRALASSPRRQLSPSTGSGNSNGDTTATSSPQYF